jgi:hypothetical protein
VLYEKGIKSKLSGNEICYTSYSILLVEKMLRSKLHRQKGLNPVPFLSKVGRKKSSSSSEMSPLFKEGATFIL